MWQEPGRPNTLLIIPQIISTGLTIVVVILDHLAKVVFSVFLHYSFFSFFALCTLWKEVTLHSPHPRSREFCFPSFRMQSAVSNCDYLKFFSMRFCLFPPTNLFIHRAFIYISIGAFSVGYFVSLTWPPSFVYHSCTY